MSMRKENWKDLSKPASSRDARAEIFDRIARQYDEHMRVTGHVDAASRLLLAVLGPGKRYGRVLDLCCGTGEMTYFIGQLAQADRIDGIDISEEMIRIAQSRFGGDGRFKFSCMEVARFVAGYVEGQYDLITVVYGVCWFSVADTVPIIYEMLASDGSFVVVDDTELQVPIFARRFPDIAEAVQSARQLRTLRDVEKVVISCGFRVAQLAEEKVGGTHTSYAMKLVK